MAFEVCEHTGKKYITLYVVTIVIPAWSHKESIFLCNSKMRHHETFYDKSPVLKELYEPYYLTSGPLFPKPLIKFFLQDDDVSCVKKLFPVLKQSACLGDNDAMYLVAVILNNGFLVTADEIQVLLHPIKSHLYQHILFILILVEYSFVFLSLSSGFGVPYDGGFRQPSPILPGNWK